RLRTRSAQASYAKRSDSVREAPRHHTRSARTPYAARSGTIRRRVPGQEQPQHLDGGQPAHDPSQLRDVDEAVDRAAPAVAFRFTPGAGPLGPAHLLAGPSPVHAGNLTKVALGGMGR